MPGLAWNLLRWLSIERTLVGGQAQKRCLPGMKGATVGILLLKDARLLVSNFLTLTFPTFFPPPLQSLHFLSSVANSELIFFDSEISLFSFHIAFTLSAIVWK